MTLTNNAWIVQLNSTSQTFALASVTQVIFAGNGGADASVIAGTLGSETAVFTPGSVQVVGNGYIIQESDTPTIYVYGNSSSTAQLYGAAGQTNIFAGTSGYSYGGHCQFVFEFCLGVRHGLQL